MPRQLKPQRVDTMAHRAYGKVDLFLDRNTLVFFAEVAGSRIESGTAEALRPLVQLALEGANAVAWSPIIEVKRDGVGGWGPANRVGFRYQRSYVARLASGQYKEVDWIQHQYAAQGGRIEGLIRACKPFRWDEAKAGPFAPPCHPLRYAGGAERDTDTIYLRHDDPTWTALETLDALLRTLRTRLETLLFTTDQVETLAARVGALHLLGAGEGGE